MGVDVLGASIVGAEGLFSEYPESENPGLCFNDGGPVSWCDADEDCVVSAGDSIYETASDGEVFHFLLKPGSRQGMLKIFYEPDNGDEEIFMSESDVEVIQKAVDVFSFQKDECE